MPSAVSGPFFSTLALSLVALPAGAESLRCGTHVISDGESVYQEEVREKCGEPDSTRGNIWVYERSGQHPVKLSFEDNGRLRSIRLLSD